MEFDDKYFDFDFIFLCTQKFFVFVSKIFSMYGKNKISDPDVFALPIRRHYSWDPAS
jgi:hypothetical protein